MDINKLLKAGKKACGRVLKLLPKDGEDGIGSPLEYMMKTLEDDTLMSINILHPMLIKKTFSTGFLTPVDVHSDEVLDLAVDNQLMSRVMNDDRYSTYRLPLSLTDGHEVISIKSCVPVRSNGASLGMYGDFYNELPWNNHFGRTSSGDLYGSTMAALVDYADRQLLGGISRGFRFYFFSPNIFMCTNYVGALNATFCCKNDPSLITCDDTTFEYVRRLFVLDLKKNIYNEFGNYTEVDTAFGTLDLKIGDWSSAENDRNELFDSLKSTAHFRTSSMRSSG